MKNKERDDKIIERYLGGESIISIGKDFNITRQRVDQIVEKNNVFRKHKTYKKECIRGSKSPITEDEINSMIALRESGLTWKEIYESNTVKYHHSTIYKICIKRRPDLALRSKFHITIN